MILYDYLVKSYGQSEPIFLASLEVPGMSSVNIRQQMKKLADEGRIKRYDSGIYFIPQESIFRSGSQLSMERVLELKYLKEDNVRCGYITGMAVANQIGLTTQVPMTVEVVTNKATKEYRETKLAKSKVIVRKPRIRVTEDNYRVLQFLDLLKDIDIFSELEGKELRKKIGEYMEKSLLSFSMLEPYLQYYPDKLFRNMYEVRVIYGVPAQG